MRPLEETLNAWQRLTTQISSLQELQTAVKDSVSNDGRSPCGDGGLRSVCWKAFLLFRNFDLPTWSHTLSDSRGAYGALKEHFLRHVEHPEEVESTVDPLTDDDATSPWVTLRQDETLRAEIFQDVERCMPENLYFREPTTQKILVDVLFIFCKLNRDVGYRQGMHELLAPILWVVERDAIDPASYRNIRVDAHDTELMRDVFNARFIEHDAFTLFSLVMQTAKTFYEMGEQESSPVASDFPRQEATPRCVSPIIERSQKIHEDYLASVDPALAEHLKEIDILPQVFLIRWIRLLFGREFSFDDLLRLWDTLFAEDPALELIDLICVVMLLPIRWELMECDYSSALALLLRYPALPAPHVPASLVLDATYLSHNLTPAGGIHLISKYTGKAPKQIPSVSRPSTPRKGAGTAQPASPRDSSLRPGRHVRTKSPLGSPGRLIQNQGGIEALLQDAAKSVYSRGEKWGVNKAVRDAVGEVKRNVQGLQSAGNSPRPSRSEKAQSPLPRGNAQDPEEAWQRVHALEARNRGLAQMLESAMEGLWSQRNETEGGKGGQSDAAEDRQADTFSLAVAKVQFVKVYLEDSTLSLPKEDVENARPTSPPRAAALTEAEGSRAQNLDSKHSPPSSAPGSPSAAKAPTSVAAAPTSPTPSSRLKPTKDTRHDDLPGTPQPEPPSTSPTRRKPSRATAPPLNPSRSTLANSSFAWVLGESERRSGYVPSARSPPLPRKDGSRKALSGKGKGSGNGSLFGAEDDDDVLDFDDDGPRGDVGRGSTSERARGGNGNGSRGGGGGEEEGFSLESLTGGGGAQPP